MDGRLLELAERQHGLIAARQARSLGLSVTAERHLVAVGRLVRIRRGVLLVRGAPRSWPQSVLSAVLAAGDPAFASHRTAARLWQLPIEPADAIEITTLIERRARIAGVRSHRSGLWDERDVATVALVPVTSPARTLADLSTELGEAGLGKALDDGLRRRILSLNAMHAVARRFDIAPGRSPKTMHAVLAKRIPGYDPGDSELETWVWETIRDAGLPPPVRRHPIAVNGNRYFIDLAYPDKRVAIEVDGFDVHRPRGSFDGDRARQNIIVLAQWRLLRYTSASLPETIVAEVREALSGQ